MVGDFIKTKVDIFDVDCITLESLTENNQSPIVNSVGEVILIVTLDLDVD